MPSFRLSKLAAEVDGAWEGETDPLITGVADIFSAGPGDLTFVSHQKYQHHLEHTKAAAVILKPGWDCPVPVLRSDDPYGAFAAVLKHFSAPRSRLFPPGIHPTAVIDPTAVLGADLAVGPGVCIGPGAAIGAGSALGPMVVIEPDSVVGENCTLYAHVVVRQGCVLGRNVILHPGVVIGTDGFGYLPGKEGLRKVPQVGRVVLDDGVEVGANSCIDRATTGQTLIGTGCKIDNLVQIAHNVVVGPNCAISAQSGISGSCVIGEGAIMGGQVGIADHRQVGDRVKIGAQSGIDRDIADDQTVFGSPAVEIKRAFRMIALTRRLPELAARLQRLEEAVLGEEQQEDR